MPNFTHNARKTFGSLFKSCWKPSTTESTEGPQSAPISAPSPRFAAPNHDAADPGTNGQDLASPSSAAHTNDAPGSTHPQRRIPKPLELGAAHSYVALDPPEIDATEPDAPSHMGGTNNSVPMGSPELTIQQTQAEPSDKTPTPRPLLPLAPSDPTSADRPQLTTHTPIPDQTTSLNSSRQSTLDLHTRAATPDTARPRGPRSRAVLVNYSL
jgi:hypothetical protein